MENPVDLMEEQPPAMDVKIAIGELQSRNAVFEERFVSLGEALVQINSGLQGLQTAVQDLVFNRQRPVEEEMKQDRPRVNSVGNNPLQRQPSRFQTFLRERNQQNNRVQILSPIVPSEEDQKSDQDEAEGAIEGVFPRIDDDEVNISFRDNEAALLSFRSKNVGMRGNKRDVKPKINNKSERRDSMIRNLDRLSSGHDENIRVYKNTPSYDHIKLTSDSISSILEFAAAIEQFQNMHKLAVPAATLISPDIREYLIGVADDHRINQMTFFGLDNKSVFALLQKLKRPKNVIDFRRAVETHLRFNIYKDYRPTLTNFKPLYSSLLVYKQNFQRLYDFLADGIRLDFIPRADNKEGGLVKIFIDKIPMGIGRRMFHNLNREKFNNIDEFISTFYHQLQLLNDISVEITKLSSVIYDSQPNYQQEKTVSRTMALTDPTQLQLVDQLLDNLESEEPADTLAFIAKNTKAPMLGQGEKKDPLACFSMAIEGSCKRENCTYSHEPAVLGVYLNETMSKIMKSPFYKPRGLVASTQPKPFHRQHALVDSDLQRQVTTNSDQLTVLNLNFQEPSMAEILRQHFLNLHPEVSNISAMHRDGAILLKKTTLQLDKVLFDSGAIHASYIDPKLVRRYRKMLEPFIRPINGSVTLGDAKTTHSVSEVVTLKLSFVDDDLEEHRGTVELVVFESGSHIIIGLPDIARTFGVLFIKMIRKAMDDPALLRHSKVRPSAQAVINHSHYFGQSLLMLSNSSSSNVDSDSLSGVNLLDRDYTSSDSDSEDSDSEDDSESSYEPELTYLDISAAYLTVPLDVSAGFVWNEFHSNHQDIRSWIEQQDAEYVGNVSDDGSEIERVIYYDSGIESSVHSSFDNSDAATAVIQYQRASSEFERPNDSEEIDEDVHWKILVPTWGSINYPCVDKG